MSGHNKWSSIKHKKMAQDSKRGKAFTKIIKEISIAARSGGSDIEMNPRLRTAVSAAKAVNMPKDNIEKAIKRGTGELDGLSYEEIVYEAYGPSGIAILIETATDNKNRTVADIRHILGKHNGNLGETGSVAWMFEKKGLISISKEKLNEEDLMEMVLDLGAIDFSSEGEEYSVYTEINDLENLRENLENKNIEVSSSEIIMDPKNTIQVEGYDIEKVLKLMDKLEDLEDVQKVHSNFEIDEEEMKRIMDE